MIENEKEYTEKEMQEKMMTQLYEKAKQSYQVAINKMANDFSLDKIKCRRLDVDKDDVKMYLSNPLKFKKQILDLSLQMFIGVSQYQSLIKYFQDMICLTPYVLPVKTSGQKSKLKKDYEDIAYKLETMNIENEYRKVVGNVILNGVFFGYEIEQNDSYTIKHLDPRYCRVIGTNDGCWMFEFDFSFFNSRRKEGNSYTDELLLKSYPEEFQKKYALYLKDRQKYQWQTLDLDKEICVRYFDNLNTPFVDFPPYLNLFGDLIDLDEYKEINKIKSKVSNYQFMALQMETCSSNKDAEMNKFTVDPALVSQYYDFLVQVCGDAITPFISPVKVEPLKFSENTNTQVTTVETAEKSYWNASGVSDTLFGTGIKTGSGLRYSIMVDEQRLYGLYTQISTILTRKMKRITNGNIFKVKIPFVTKYNKSDMIAQSLQMAQYGIGSKLELFALNGNTPAEVLSTQTFENDLLDLANKLVPLQSSHTTSGSLKEVKGATTRGRPATSESNEANSEESAAANE